MNLDTYLRDKKVSRSEFARRVGVVPSAVTTWLTVPGRGPSGAVLAKIEVATSGAVTARDFSWGEGATRPVRGRAHEPATGEAA
jgi:hypothetical protein